MLNNLDQSRLYPDAGERYYVGGPQGPVTPVYDTLVDEVSAELSYVCEAAVGAVTSAAEWRVRRVQTTGAVTVIRYAGAGGFDQVADDRATLTYT